MVTKAKIESKKPTVREGRDTKGRFLKGNGLCVGGLPPTVHKSKELKQALLDAVSVQDIKEIAEGLVEKAKTKDVAAIKELLDRLLGKPHQTHDIAVETKAYSPEKCDAIREMMAQQCN